MIGQFAWAESGKCQTIAWDVLATAHRPKLWLTPFQVEDKE